MSFRHILGVNILYFACGAEALCKGEFKFNHITYKVKSNYLVFKNSIIIIKIANSIKKSILLPKHQY